MYKIKKSLFVTNQLLYIIEYLYIVDNNFLGMVSNKCIVVNCNNSSKKKHRFPTVHEDCVERVHRSGNKAY